MEIQYRGLFNIKMLPYRDSHYQDQTVARLQRNNCRNSHQKMMSRQNHGHDDIYDMGILSTLLALCEANPPVCESLVLSLSLVGTCR